MIRDIVCDSGLKSICAKIIKFYDSWKIKRVTPSPYYPGANGQAKLMNKILIKSLKKILKAAKGRWPEELPGLLWLYRIAMKQI